MKKYIGITIGPIFDTMNLVSSPSALWASSYIFSYISRSICEKLTEKYGITEIVSPYFNKNDKTLFVNNGIGLFHDRIIFVKPEGFDIKKIQELRKSIIDDVSQKFDIDNTDGYMDKYIMLVAAEFEAENPLLEGDPILNSLELSKKYVATERKNPILGTFNSTPRGKEEEAKRTARNQRIKEVVKCNLKIDGWQLFKDNENDIKDLESIAKCDDTDKKYNDYCAIVRADGDRIGTIIKGITDFNAFSETCFKYCSAAAELVKDFGGVTIYSGGDDLLAILPCRSEKGTLFDFSFELQKLFNEKFNTYIENTVEPKPSLSTGIFIFYKNFPLYEALSESVDLLFSTAKSRRNCLALNLRKHSGQSVKIIIPNGSLTKVIELKDKILGNADKDEIILSALQKISLFNELFDLANTDEQIKNLFINTFDASYHIGNDFLHNVLAEHYNSYRNTSKTPIYSADETAKFADTFSALLRVFKFYTEKGGEK